MSEKRKFYRTVIQVEILSEEPYEGDDLNTIASDTDTGDCSGQITDIERNQEVTGKEMVALLQKQGSDSEFFQLDAEGNDLEDDEEDEEE